MFFFFRIFVIIFRGACKISKPYNIPFCGFSNGGKNKNKNNTKSEKITKISNSADGGPRSQVCTCETLPLGPPMTLAEMFRHQCLQSNLQTSPPVPQKSYPMFQTPTTTLRRFSPKLGFFPPNLGVFWEGRGTGGIPKWFGGKIYTFDGKKKPPVKFQNSY